MAGVIEKFGEKLFRFCFICLQLPDLAANNIPLPCCYYSDKMPILQAKHECSNWPVTTSQADETPLRCVHGNDAAKGRLATAGRGPEDGVVGGRVGERPVEIGQKDHCLWVDSVLIEPFEAGTEVCTAAADRIEVKELAGRVGIDLVHFGVEVENMHPLGPLAFQNGTNLGLKEPQLPRIDRSGAVYGNRDFARAFTHNAGQIETGPDVAAVGPHPTRIGRDSVGPETAQQFPPIDLGFRRSLQEYA